MKSKHQLLIIFLLVLAIAACKKSTAPKPEPATTSSTSPTTAPTALPVTNADVYVAGQVTAANYNTVATYWKNGTAIALADSSVSSSASAITIQGGDIYVAGYTTLANGNTVATYWKNGVPNYNYGIVSSYTTNLGYSTTIAPYSTASAIAVQGNDVYLAGETAEPRQGYSISNWWKNGIASDSITFYNNISDNTPFYGVSSLRGILIQGSNVYTAGSRVDRQHPYAYAIYTKNDSTYSLPAILFNGYDNSGANAIVLVGTDIYIAGFSANNITSQYAAYWKNNTFVEVTTPNSTANAIAIQGSDIYLAGYSASAATYWKNGTATKINTGSSLSAIAVSGSYIYLAGQNAAGYAAYWVNGVAVQLGKAGSVASGIALVSK